MTSYFNLLKGDAIQQLRTLAPNSVHAVITDPPYGLTSGHDINEMLSSWLSGKAYVNPKSGYNGNGWDNSVPGPELWQEVERVVMPGGFVLAFGASRTSHLTALALELAGFDLRDSIHWVYAPGCQRSKDLSNYPELDGSIALQYSVKGMRTTLKPGHEPITVARKRMYEGQDLLGSMLDYKLGAINHNGFLDKTKAVASNVLVVHDLDCTENTCLCGIATDASQQYSTPIYPHHEIPNASLNFPKPKKSERPKSADGTSHETVKPIALMQTLIRAFSAPGQIILDPFLGSGTTAEAALVEGRNIIGCEITPKYWPLILGRFASLEMRRFDVRLGSPFTLQSTSVLTKDKCALSTLQA
ncbi:MAG: site-specific DNA-methyltransferase [Candidatus Planktophila sp.]|nr:site-specific DNA-methyltransferase [Candidatus Planktophila sp.]